MSDNRELRDLRDRLAGLCGWWTDEMGEWCHEDHGTRLLDHPFEPNDLTALAAVWPEGVGLMVSYRSTRGVPCVVHAADVLEECFVGETEYDARLRLTVAVLEAMA